MAKSIKLQNDTYIDISNITKKREPLDNYLIGIGTTCKNVSSTTKDWNTACGTKTGFYMGWDLSNAPYVQNDSANWFFIIHLAHNDSYQVQIAIPFFNSDRIFKRNKQNGSWTNWKEFSFI